MLLNRFAVLADFQKLANSPIHRFTYLPMVALNLFTIFRKKDFSEQSRGF